MEKFILRAGNPYKNASIDAAKRKQASKTEMPNKFSGMSDEEIEKIRRFEMLTSERKDTHAMQYSFYSRKN